jgi:hypothetical protein
MEKGALLISRSPSLPPHLPSSSLRSILASDLCPFPSCAPQFYDEDVNFLSSSSLSEAKEWIRIIEKILKEEC